MYKIKRLLNIADDLNQMQNIEEVSQYYVRVSSMFEQEQHNLIVLLLGMCINRELTIRISGTQYVSVEEFPKKQMEIYHDLMTKYKQKNPLIIGCLSEDEDQGFFLTYLDHITECLLSGIEYKEKKADMFWQDCDQWNEWNTSIVHFN